MSHPRSTLACVALAALTGGYLWATDAAHFVYALSILAHPILGLGLLVAVVMGWTRVPQHRRGLLGAALAAMALSGVVLAVLGGSTPWVGVLHGVAGFLAAAVVAWIVGAVRERPGPALRGAWAAFGLAVLLPLAFAAWPDDPDDTITNPAMSPATMADEAMGGADGPFFPSAIRTAHGDLIDGDFFLDSEGCGRSGCHEDVTAQWRASAHHLSSFNNQWYRKSIEYMQEVVGTQKAQWCAGCHDHALLLSGQMDQPVADFLDTPEAHAGLGCVSCHSVSKVGSTLGNGDLTIEVPAMHDLAVSEQPILRTLHDLTLHLDPAPHREAFLRPFLREQPSEFCSSCHKVHLDEPVNGYRWVRGFNTYDNWQASGVSGEGARSFYAPPEPQTCVSCHMPEMPSDDAGNRDGLVRSHAFLAANTALPTAYADDDHLARTKAFLKAGQLTLDLFAVSLPGVDTPTASADAPAPSDPTALATTFAVGEERGMTPGSGSVTRTATPVRGALRDGDAALARGTTTRLDLVVRTRGLGHFFPTGTVDAQEAWIEIEATDAEGRVLLVSGTVDTTGTVDAGAHFYRNLMVDVHANPIDKRNAFATRATVYVNLIPPGAADVVHYRLAVPEGVASPVTVVAKLHYRKFTDAYTRFSYGGRMQDDLLPARAFTADYDDRTWTDGPVPADVPGVVKTVPTVPIVTMAADTLKLQVTARDGIDTETGADAADDEATAMRWNDYGIGLLREGDLKSAAHAFAEVTRLHPSYADGWVNRARVALQESDLDAADRVLAEALALRPGFPKARYFRALAHKERGDLEAARSDLEAVAEAFPRDRVVLGTLGRVLFLGEQFEPSVAAFERVLAIDPEDVMAHYNLMLAYQALGDAERAGAHRLRYERYKEDEAGQAIARQYRQRDPNANREALPVHVH